MRNLTEHEPGKAAVEAEASAGNDPTGFAHDKGDVRDPPDATSRVGHEGLRKVSSAQVGLDRHDQSPDTYHEPRAAGRCKTLGARRRARSTGTRQHANDLLS